MTKNKVGWDYCQIKYKLRDKGEEITYGGFKQIWLVFLALAAGSDKNYLAGESSEIPVPANVIGAAYRPQKMNPGHVNIHQNLLKKLERNGWELLPDKGGAWWDRQLRRPARLSNSG